MTITTTKLEQAREKYGDSYIRELAGIFGELTDGKQVDDTDPRFVELRDKYRRQAKPRGLGDTVEKVLDKTGIGPVAKRVIQRVTGKPCGCGKRRDALNKIVPYSAG